jgi:hypothetical protein
MANQHPITPPLELQDKWRQDWYKSKVKHIQLEDHIATQAARWGADQELEACCEWLDRTNHLCPWATVDIDELRDARRPKPPTLKEQALKALEVEDDAMPLRSLERGERFDLIRRALEALPND